MNFLPENIEAYIDTLSNTDDPILDEIERSTHLHTIAPQMLSGRTQGAFLSMLVRLIHAKNILEVGTFTGYGAICMAKGFSDKSGKVVTLEANREMKFLIDKHLSMSGLSDQIEVVYGDALKIIPERSETWDIVYIDANKVEYLDYFHAVFEHVRPGGLILSDNVLWSGKVVDDPTDVDARAIRKYNQFLRDDPRVQVVILPIRDGLSMAMKL